MMSFDELLSRLSSSAAELDESGRWPEEQLDGLARSGVTGWVIPREYGGSDISEEELTHGYEWMAAACLNTAFILTQRNGACQRIAASDNVELKTELLPDLAAGKTFATVGISHLSTSRQHLVEPSVRVAIEGDSLRVNGFIPWVTGAARAQTVVTGGTCADGRQVLLALPMDSAGIEVLPHARLMALTASWTASLRLHDVELPASRLIAGPVENVMSRGSGGAGSLTTSTLALGLAVRSAALISEQAAMRPDLRDISDQFQSAIETLREEILQSVTGGDSAGTLPSPVAIRQQANSLSARISQAALAVSKGAGFVQGHPAERAVREAMFFLVWSCPQPVVRGVLEELSCP